MSGQMCCKNVWGGRGGPCSNYGKYTDGEKYWCGIHVPYHVRSNYPPTGKPYIRSLETLLARAYDWMQPMPCSASCASEVTPGQDCSCERCDICNRIDAMGFMGEARTVQITRGEE